MTGRVELTEIRHTDQEIRNHESSGSIQAIGSFLDKCSAILEKSRNVRHGHEGHERRAEELAVVSLHLAFSPGNHGEHIR